MIKYLGSKRTLIPLIMDVVSDVNPDVVGDAFSGTSRVGHALKRSRYKVLSNDLSTYAHVLAKCYVEADSEQLLSDAVRIIADLSRVEPCPGWFTETYCEKARFFQPKNGAKIESIRNAISDLDISGTTLEAVLLTSLMEAADRVDSTVGIQMAFLKKWAKRSFNDLELRVPDILPGEGCQAVQGDAEDFVKRFSGDLVYMDPPYNQHKYLGNYHIWETLVRWDNPEVYGVAQKRIDVKERKSPYNSKPRAFQAMKSLCESAAEKWRYLLISYSDEGYIQRDQFEDILHPIGEVSVFESDYKRYIGHHLGGHSPSGDRVSVSSHSRNKEILFLVKVR